MYIPHTLTLNARRAVEMYHHGRALAGYRDGWEEAALAFALAVILNLRDVLAEPAGWEGEVLAEVAQALPVHARVALPRLAQLARRALLSERRDNPEPGEASLRCDAAVRAYTEARRVRDAGGRWLDAEDGFKAALRIARNAADWETEIHTMLGLAEGYRRQGRYVLARRYLDRAETLTVTHGHRALLGQTLHDLTALAIHTGNDSAVGVYAARALEAYPSDHPRIPNLIHDVAQHWHELGYYGPARATLEAVIPHLVPGTAIAGWGALATVEGATGRSAEFERAAASVLRLVAESVHDVATLALIAVGRGALYLGDRGAAESYGMAALDRAAARSETLARSGALALIEGARRAGEAASVSRLGRQDEERTIDGKRRLSLAQAMVSTLREREAEMGRRLA